MRAAAAFLICVGCSTITSAPQYDSTQLDSLAKHVSVTADPPPDSDGNIVRDAVLHVVLDGDYPDPEIVVFGQILLQSGSSTFDVDMKVDLVDRTVLVQPRSLLSPNTQYELIVDQHFRALSGRTMGKSMSFTISVGDQLNPSPSPSPAPLTWDNDIVHILGGCANQCHSPDGCLDPSTGKPVCRNPTSNLCLTGDKVNCNRDCDIHDPVLGLINVTSELMKDEARPLLRVKPGDSANSELLRKLLGGDPHAGRWSGEPVPADVAVPGRRMPLFEPLCGAPAQNLYLDDDKLRQIRDWIDQGAN